MKLIPLTRGLFAEVDDEDFEWLNQWKWHAQKHATTHYAARIHCFENTRTTIMMHQLIIGDHPLKLKADHKDCNGLNNQRSNLRFCTISQNSMNKRKRLNCASIYKGVTWHKKSNRWVSRINKNGKTIYCKFFISELEAAKQYDIWALEIFGEFARPNI